MIPSAVVRKIAGALLLPPFLAAGLATAGTAAHEPPPYTQPGYTPRAESRDEIGGNGGYFDIFTRGAFDSNNGNQASFGLEAQVGPHFGRHQLYTGIGLAGWFSQGSYVDATDGKRLNLSRSEWTIPFGYRYKLPVTRELSLEFGPAGGVVFESFKATSEEKHRYQRDNGDDIWEALFFGGYSRCTDIVTRHDDVKTRGFFGGDFRLAWTPGHSTSVTLGYAYRQYGDRNYDFGGRKFRFERTQEHIFSLGAKFDF